MTFDYLMEQKRAVDFLAGNLNRGTLVLVLGAGTSVGSGLPDWLTLVNCLRKEAKLDVLPPGATADTLQSSADEVRRDFCRGNDKEFARLVKACLYKGVALSSNLLKDELLIALGALMIGSRRGSVKRILTPNFDCMLEWYLTLHGFVPKVILRPPALEGAEDVRIYHPHGFLPHPDLHFPESDFVILGLESVNVRLGTPGDPWFELMRHLFRTGVCLFVGLSVVSFRDRALAPLLATVGKELQNTRPTGFWLLPGDGTEPGKKEFLASNIVPMYYGSHKEAPNLLLSICRKAAETIEL